MAIVTSLLPMYNIEIIAIKVNYCNKYMTITTIDTWKVSSFSP